MTTIEDLPEGCIAAVISCTSPADACRLCCVNSLFKAAANSDTVWDKFLPSVLPSGICNNSDPSSTAHGGNSRRSSSASTKKFYLTLSNNPVLIEGGKMSFQIDRQSGKKCYMISPRNLSIVWGDTPAYWRWTAVEGSRFPEIAELVRVCWFEIRGKMPSSILSPRTTYAAYLVFKSVVVAFGFANQPVEVAFGFAGRDIDKRSVCLDSEGGVARNPVEFRCPRIVRVCQRRRVMQWATSVPRENQHGLPYPKERQDGWLEVELGEVFVGEGEMSELEMSVMEVAGGNWKEGLVIQGIEIRPKSVAM